MMGAVATRRNVRNPKKCAKGIIIEGVGGKEVFVLVVARSRPEVSDLLRLDLLVAFEGRAIQRWCRNL